MLNPMSGIRVVELGNFLAVPFAGLQLADLGADVVKVEHPSMGDEMRATLPRRGKDGAAFLALNRNKRSVAIDLKQADGAAVFADLVDTADVVLENLRPGAMTKLGLDFECLKVRNPGLVYISASGWGRDSPDASLPGLDIMAQARSGLMSITGDPDGPPSKVGVPICDLACGLYVTIAACAALSARQLNGGVGQYADVSLFETGVSLAVWESARYFTTREVSTRNGSAHQALAPYQALATKTGWITVGAITPKTWEAFCAVMHLEPLLADERYCDAATRFEHRGSLIPTIEAVTTTAPTEFWVEYLQGAGVPCAPIQGYDGVFSDPLLVERGFLWEAEHPTAGTVRQLGSPMRFGATPTRRERTAPMLGEHTREVLHEIGFDETTLDDLEARLIIGTSNFSMNG